MTGEDRITDREYVELQQRFGGQYVARRNGTVIANSEVFDELMDTVESMTDDQREHLVIELIEPANCARVY